MAKKKKLTESAEDHLEAIYKLEKKKGYARTSDLSSFFGIKASSVTEMIQKLARYRLVNYEKYGGVTLTAEGKMLAKEISKRHEILTNFLEAIGVDKETAEEDACRIEHVVHKETMERLRKFMALIKKERIAI